MVGQDCKTHISSNHNNEDSSKAREGVELKRSILILLSLDTKQT